MALFNMFSLERGQPLSSVALFVWSLVTLGWFVNSSTDVVAWLGRYIWKVVTHDGKPLPPFGDQFPQTMIPGILLVLTIAGLYINYRRNREPGEVLGIAAEPHRGLIVQLGVYAKRDSKYETPDQVSAGLANRNLEMGELFKSNLGPFALAARYHAPPLEHCWILTTKQTEEDFPLAETLIKFIAGDHVKCYCVSVPDPNDIGLTASVVRSIYLQDTLPAKDIIADFTGGTAAMSGGMILATLDADQDLEYLRQDRSYFGGDGAPKGNDAIRKEAILMSPRTSREMITKILGNR